VPGNALAHQGRLYQQAAEYAAALEASQTAAVDQMLAAWTDSYWAIRQEMDQFLAKVAAARAAGDRVSPAWAYQQQRLKNLLDETKRQIAQYAVAASAVTEKSQAAAIAAALKHAERLAKGAVAVGLPGLEASLATVNPAVLQAGVGFLADGSVLRAHLAATLPAQAAEAVKDALIHGLATGKGQDWMIRAATQALGLSHARATTILRTESLRAYRAASKATYEANADLMEGWTWHANLDARCCVACVLMDGTLHPVTATLDGHPRCRCAMVPRTKSWEDLGVEGAENLPDTRPPVRSGKDWLEAQDPSVQRAIMGKAKFQAWQDGQITLDDMVARPHSPEWGTMRTERSLKAIQEGRDANWMDRANDAPTTPTPPQAKVPEPVDVAPPTRRPQPDLGPEPPARKGYPESEYTKAAETLRLVDDETLLGVTRHKDPRVAWLARREYLDRLALRPPPLNTLEAGLPRIRTGPPPEFGSAEWLADMQAVNPNYSLGREWQVNCTNCTTTYEMRRRGYDVTAQARLMLKGRPSWEVPAAWDADVVEGMTEVTLRQAIKAALKHGEGARGAISVNWAGGGGHIFNWEVVNGKVLWADAQPGWNGDDLLAYLERKIKGKVRLYRLDHLPLNDLLADYYSTR
jgi:SPP1 gp7 family putative phage head morphogenesis protein